MSLDGYFLSILNCHCTPFQTLNWKQWNRIQHFSWNGTIPIIYGLLPRCGQRSDDLNNLTKHSGHSPIKTHSSSLQYTWCHLVVRQIPNAEMWCPSNIKAVKYQNRSHKFQSTTFVIENQITAMTRGFLPYTRLDWSRIAWDFWGPIWDSLHFHLPCWPTLCL